MKRGVKRFALGACAALLFAGFFALGVWQLERRIWKLDLIERVEKRVHAAAVDAPPPSVFRPADDEYRHVKVAGRYLYERELRVKAVTRLGEGFWVLTPLQVRDGAAVLVNRGFVPADAPALPAGPGGDVTVTGLLRLTEPRGGFLRRNDPGAGHWFSRDVAAIAAAQGLQQVAPYFIDADADTTGQAGPVGGLTVVSFHNSHLVYAITWFALALMSAAGGWVLLRHDRQDDRPAN